MTLAATILVPTHDHGSTLSRSVGSALAQTVEELEVLVVGDGAPDVTRELMAGLVAADARVRWFDNAKGPRHGELHRHAALQEARGEIVCYLCDDDLLLPDHVERMRGLLEQHDFAHTHPFWIDPEGELHCYRVDLGLEYFRELFRGGENRVPLSCGAHTLELYRRLPAGWRTTPEDIYTDLYMWQQILSVPGVRVARSAEPTVLHFPSPERIGWSSDERLAELDRWATRMQGPDFSEELRAAVLATATADAAGLETAHGAVANAYAAVSAHAAALTEQLAAVESERRSVASWAAGLERDLEELSSSVTWRLRRRLLSVPGLRGPLRAAARALAGGAAPGATGSRRPGPRPAPPETATGSRAPDPPSDSPARRRDPSTR
jgi:GalNAc5-diNAcBac-PP-undecaprenol beta-1,3-glucosyltransferase